MRRWGRRSKVEQAAFGGVVAGSVPGGVMSMARLGRDVVDPWSHVIESSRMRSLLDLGMGPATTSEPPEVKVVAEVAWT